MQLYYEDRSRESRQGRERIVTVRHWSPVGHSDVAVRSLLDCQRSCSSSAGCWNFNYFQDTRRCELFYFLPSSFIIGIPQCTHYEVGNIGIRVFSYCALSSVMQKYSWLIYDNMILSDFGACEGLAHSNELAFLCNGIDRHEIRAENVNRCALLNFNRRILKIFPVRHAFSGNYSKQLQRHYGVHLSSVYIDYSFSSW